MGDYGRRFQGQPSAYANAQYVRPLQQVAQPVAPPPYQAAPRAYPAIGMPYAMGSSRSAGYQHGEHAARAGAFSSAHAPHHGAQYQRAAPPYTSLTQPPQAGVYAPLPQQHHGPAYGVMQNPNTLQQTPANALPARPQSSAGHQWGAASLPQVEDSEETTEESLEGLDDGEGGDLNELYLERIDAMKNINNFLEVHVEGEKFTQRSGRIGESGTSKSREYISHDEAVHIAEKAIERARKRGFKRAQKGVAPWRALVDPKPPRRATPEAPATTATVATTSQPATRKQTAGPAEAGPPSTVYRGSQDVLGIQRDWTGDILTSIPAWTDDAIEKRATNAGTYQRGVAYAREKAIISGEVKGNVMTAISTGSNGARYDIQLRFSPSGYITEGGCSCPVGLGGHCKHSIALLITWRDDPKFFSIIKEDEETSQQETAASGRRLPREFVGRVLALLDPYTAAVASRVCKTWRELAPAHGFWASLEMAGDGSAGYLDCGTHPSLCFDQASFTLEAWIRPRHEKSSGVILSKCNRGVAAEYVLELHEGKLRVFRNVAPYLMTALSEVRAGEWMHVAVTYSGLWCRLYINGVEEGSQSWNSCPTIPKLNVLIGAVLDGGKPTCFFDGHIHEVRVWSSCRTQSRLIQSMYRRPAISDDLVAMWRHNGDGSVLPDLTGKCSAAVGITIEGVASKPPFTLAGWREYLHNPFYPPDPESAAAAAATEVQDDSNTATDVGQSTSAAKAPSLNAPALWEIPLREVKLGRRLGSGAFGAVNEGKWRGTDVAVKQMLSGGEADNESLVQTFLKEIDIVSRLRPNPHVVQFLGAVIAPPQYYIISELLQAKSVESWLQDAEAHLSLFVRVGMACDAAKGMLHVHAENLIHQDLACRNLLVDTNFRVKVTDFGLSRIRSSTLTDVSQAIGTPATMAPELIQGQAISNKIDVYSFGVCLWEIYTRDRPWEGFTPMQIAWKVVSEQRRPVVPQSCPDLYGQLLTRCWAQLPADRPTFADIVEELVAFQGVLPPNQ